jgi:archaellum component FlaG (FlaF/FlaG flagellin family)
MSYNPYNRREISIEVGDYIPSISDSLYRIEQLTNEIQSNVSDSTAEIKTAVNSAEISLSEKVQRLFKITFNALQSTYASFCSTVKFVLTNTGNVTFILKKDENEIMRYEENFSEGSHTKTYTYPFTSESGQNTLSLCAVTSDGAVGTFPKMQSWGYVMGAYLAGDNPVGWKRFAYSTAILKSVTANSALKCAGTSVKYSLYLRTKCCVKF